MMIKYVFCKHLLKTFRIDLLQKYLKKLVGPLGSLEDFHDYCVEVNVDWRMCAYSSKFVYFTNV